MLAGKWFWPLLLQVVASDERARSISAARVERSEAFRQLQMAVALHAQRQKEQQALSVESQRRRSLRAEMMGLLAQRKLRTAEKLAQVGEVIRQPMILVRFFF